MNNLNIHKCPYLLKLQSEIALSTLEAEYITLSQGMRELVYARRLMFELGKKMKYDLQSMLHVSKVWKTPQLHITYWIAKHWLCLLKWNIYVYNTTEFYQWLNPWHLEFYAYPRKSNVWIYSLRDWFDLISKMYASEWWVGNQSNIGIFDQEKVSN